MYCGNIMYSIDSLSYKIEELDDQQLFKLMQKPYSDTDFSEIAYNLCNKHFNKYRDPEFASEIKSLSRALIPEMYNNAEEFYRKDKSNKCLILKTSYKYDSIFDTVKEFQFHVDEYPFGAVRVFSAKLINFNFENIISYSTYYLFKEIESSWVVGDLFIAAIHDGNGRYEILLGKVTLDRTDIKSIRVNRYNIEMILINPRNFIDIYINNEIFENASVVLNFGRIFNRYV